MNNSVPLMTLLVDGVSVAEVEDVEVQYTGVYEAGMPWCPFEARQAARVIAVGGAK